MLLERRALSTTLEACSQTIAAQHSQSQWLSSSRFSFRGDDTSKNLPNWATLALSVDGLEFFSPLRCTPPFQMKDVMASHSQDTVYSGSGCSLYYDPGIHGTSPFLHEDEHLANEIRGYLPLAPVP